MDRDALNELFDYTAFTWESYGRALKTLPPDALARPLDTGWPTLRDVLFHVAAGWDGWLRDRLGLDDPLDATPESLATWDDAQALRAKVRGWLRRVIDEAPDDVLRAKTDPMGEGALATTLVSPADVLTHILLHERGHHGDVTTALSQLGAQIGPSDFLVYEWFRQQRVK
jgi:uncharacterized damage-inducible protein DinB